MKAELSSFKRLLRLSCDMFFASLFLTVPPKQFRLDKKVPAGSFNHNIINVYVQTSMCIYINIF